jgi:hypothetical protein
MGGSTAFDLRQLSEDCPLLRRRFKQAETLEQRLASEARRLREESRLLPPSPARSEALRKARQAEIAAHLSDWLRSPGLKPPK